MHGAKARLLWWLARKKKVGKLSSFVKGSLVQWHLHPLHPLFLFFDANLALPKNHIGAERNGADGADGAEK